MHPASPSPQAENMQQAIQAAVRIGPQFLQGRIDADRMATAMVAAVRDYQAKEHAAGRDGRPHDLQTQTLNQAIIELQACGSGYLAGRCDGACVARTMHRLIEEFAG